MNLPWLGLQALYVHGAWAMVLAACGVGLLARRAVFPARLATAWVGLCFVACSLPGMVSPAYWLGLAFQLPSLLLVTCCAMTIRANFRGTSDHRVLPAGLAIGLFVAGWVLYVDTAGWLHFGLYVRGGFGPEAAFAGLLIGAAAVLAIATGVRRAASFAVLFSTLVYALCRLPSGNVWDALLDPLLWLWSIVSLLARLLVRRPPRELPLAS